MAQLVQKTGLLTAGGILAQPASKFGISRKEATGRASCMMACLDAKHGRHWQQRPVLVSTTNAILSNGEIGHCIGSVHHTFQHSEFVSGIALRSGLLELGDHDLEVVVLYLQTHQPVIGEESIAALVKAVALGLLVGVGNALGPFDDVATGVEHTDTENLVLVDGILAILHVLVRHVGTPVGRSILLARPHLQRIQNLTDIVAARLGNSFSGILLNVHLLHPRHLNGPTSNHRLDGALVLQIQAMIRKGAHLLALSIITDANDGHLALLNHGNQLRHTRSIAGAHTIDLVHDDASLLLDSSGLATLFGAEIEDLTSTNIAQILLECLLAAGV